MADTVSKEKRSWNMSRIRAKDTKIEVAVRKYLFANGFRYRKNVKELPGKPDIVLPKYKAVIFVHGCYWHRHQGCKNCTTPSTNTEFWLEKFNTNVENDRKHKEQLETAGWRVLVLWECEIEQDFEPLMESVVSWLKSNQPG